MIWRGWHLWFLIGVFALAGQQVLAAQDTSDSEDQQQTTEAEAGEQEAAASAQVQTAEEPQPKTLYFIGPRVRAERQQGPSIGAPQSIRPQPYLPPGTLIVPPPGDTAPDEVEGLAAGAQALPDATEADPADLDAVRSEEFLEAEPGAQDTAPAAAGGFLEGQLEQLDPSGMPVAGDGPVANTVWQGYSRQSIEQFLGGLAQPSLSPALTRLAGQIARSRFVLPAAASEQEVVSLIENRLHVFQATADTEAYIALVDGLPADRDWSPLSRHLARAHLIKGELPDACAVAQQQRAEDDDPYWVRLAAFCMAATGNRGGVDFQLGILEETIEVDPVFYQLLDQILVEAEQLPGAVLPPAPALNGALKTDVLTVAMARLARVRIQDVDALSVNPLAVVLLLQNPNLDRSAQAKLLSYLLARGIAGGERVAALARSLPLEPGEDELAFSVLAAAEAAVDGADQPETTVDLIDTDTLETVLLALVADGSQPERQARALGALWRIQSENGRQVASAPAFNALLLGSSVPSDTAVAEIAARSALLAGDSGAFRRWSRLLRISVAGEDADTDAALRSLWPLIALADDGATPVAQSRLGLWWQQQVGEPDRYRLANLLFSVGEALGRPVPGSLWQALNDGPSVIEGVSVAPALWRRYLGATAGQDPIAALSSLYQLLSEIGPADMPPAVAGSLVSGLVDLGFDQAARDFALELLIAQGL